MPNIKCQLIALFVLAAGCSSRKQEQQTSGKNTTDTIPNVAVATTSESDEEEDIETFIDSTRVGVKGKCKVVITKHHFHHSAYVVVNFYLKQHSGWTLKSQYTGALTPIAELNTEIKDFNNDGFNDITFKSAIAGRSANEIRRLFIYDRTKQHLTFITNSDEYPNLRYNDELNCIDAFLVYGGTSTVFARIEGDSLKEFASVHNDNNRTVYEFDKNGNKTLIRKDTIINSENVYVRYKNYKPLKMYK